MAEDYGIKISKPFRDVNTAADYDLLFNSSWPSIAIAHEETITQVMDGTLFTPSTTHDLGFPPFSMMWATANGLLVDFRLPFVTNTTAYYENLTASSFDLPDGTTVVFHIKCYNVDMSVEKEYPLLRTSGLDTTYDPDYGIKIAREGEDIESTDLRDFILHSRAQSPAVLAVKTEATTDDGTDYEVDYTSPANYTPWVFAYGKNINGAGVWTPALLYSQAVPRLSYISGTSFRLSTTTVAGNGEAGGAIIVLRDPLFSATDQEIYY